MLQDLKKASSGETLSDEDMGNGSVLSASNSQRKVCLCHNITIVKDPHNLSRHSRQMSGVFACVSRLNADKEAIICCAMSSIASRMQPDAPSATVLLGKSEQAIRVNYENGQLS